MLQNGLT